MYLTEIIVEHKIFMDNTTSYLYFVRSNTFYDLWKKQYLYLKIEK